MQISDLVGQYSRNVANGTEELHGAQSVQKLVSTIGDLSAGSIFEGTINSVRGGKVTLALGNGQTITARLDGKMDLQQGSSIEDGPCKNYFAWSCATDGSKNAEGPAPDGEEYFAMALFFAANRWGNGTGIFHYADEARAILRECIHKGEPGHPGEPMWDTSRHLIKFITNCNFSDPSYHLPHFYELFARWADEDDREFWRDAAEASRAYLHLACHPDTGLSAEYAEYDGTPHEGHQEIFGRHDWYYSDAYRTIANIAMDWLWFGRDPWQQEIAGKLQSFYCEKQSGHWDGVFLTDGTLLTERALHPVAVIAVNAEASLAAKGENAKECIRRFWETPLRTGERRYYDNFLYLFAMLALSGNYRIY